MASPEARSLVAGVVSLQLLKGLLGGDQPLLLLLQQPFEIFLPTLKNGNVHFHCLYGGSCVRHALDFSSWTRPETSGCVLS
jgi:hypothetical protein